MRAHRELQNDPLAYVHNIGKQDRPNTLRALEKEGRDTIVRLCFAPNSLRVPLRFLGYIAAAQHITRKYLPEAQLQLVSTVRTIARENFTPEKISLFATLNAISLAYQHPAIQNSKPKNLAFAIDKHDSYATVREDRILPLTRNYREAETLANSAKARNSQYHRYVAAHVAMHDMVNTVTAMSATLSTQALRTEAETIISIGGLSERSFYDARMRCRQAPLFDTEAMVKTGQLFTNHVVPPYLFSQRGTFDPSIGTPRAAFLHLQELRAEESFMIRADSLKRDLSYLQDFIDFYAPDESFPAPSPRFMSQSSVQ